MFNTSTEPREQFTFAVTCDVYLHGEDTERKRVLIERGYSLIHVANKMQLAFRRYSSFEITSITKQRT